MSDLVGDQHNKFIWSDAKGRGRANAQYRPFPGRDHVGVDVTADHNGFDRLRLRCDGDLIDDCEQRWRIDTFQRFRLALESIPSRKEPSRLRTTNEGENSNDGSVGSDKGNYAYEKQNDHSELDQQCCEERRTDPTSTYKPRVFHQPVVKLVSPTYGHPSLGHSTHLLRCSRQKELAGRHSLRAFLTSSSRSVTGSKRD
jgi:hypothetical protein